MKFHNLRKSRTQKMLILSLAMLSTSLTLFAEIALPAMFTDNMVLQQQTDAPIWGTAKAKKNVKVTTSWDKKTYTVQAGIDGNWTIKVKTPAASLTPFTITFSDGKAFVLKNVLIGEVWICSGQSNMEMPVAGWGKVKNNQQEVANANYPNIRLLHVSKRTANVPLNDLKLENGGWKECSPATIPEFSSAAYFFGRNLFQNLNIPIGLINTSWGGTIAETWMSAETAETMPDFTERVKNMKGKSDEEQQVMYLEQLKSWEENIKNVDCGYKNKVAIFTIPGFDDASWKTMPVPGMWESKLSFIFDGVAWFRKTITIPEDWAGKDLKLSLGAIDDNDVTFFNGEQIGSTNGFMTARNYTIPANLVKGGTAVITIRILDTAGDGGFYGGNMSLSLSDNQKLDLTGDWKCIFGTKLRDLPQTPSSPINNPNRPTVLYNAMIHPLVPYAIRGAIWYQGEANADRAYQYREVFPLLIADWRKQFNKDLAFYFVQLANYMKVDKEPVESNWAELREAQAQTLHLENTGMAVTIDIGEAGDIHPKNKQDVGLRLALAARANTYGQKIAFSGPIYDTYKMEGNKVRISFKYTNDGLKTNDGQAVKGFAMAGLDHKFHWADATIEGNEVVVTCPEVSFPVAVRYAWANNPVCNLYNGAGLPTSPFRTDDWQGNTYGNNK